MMRSNAVGVQRLLTHRLAGTRFTTPEDVVRWMGALQAQAYGQVVWAMGLRTHAATLAQVEQAIAERHILLTWPLRGTLHVVPAEDARWMLMLSEPRTRRGASRRLAQLDLNETILERCMTLFYDALHGGKRLTRAALMTIVEEAGISPTGQRGYHILWHAAQRGLICLGPMEGTQQAFVLLDEWVPASRVLAREEAVAELARRYFSSHGPATLRDFAGWAGLTLTEARSGLDAVGSELVALTTDTTDYWMSSAVVDSPVPDAATVFLLPGFDEYVLGYKDRRDVLAPEHASKIVPGNNGVFLPALVVAGHVVGTWTRRRATTALGLTLHPFAPLATPQESIAAAAQRYSAFLGVPVTSIEVTDA